MYNYDRRPKFHHQTPFWNCKLISCEVSLSMMITDEVPYAAELPRLVFVDVTGCL